MTDSNNRDNLSPPHLRLAGLQIWVQGRRFPASNDSWDGNWLNIVAQCSANRAEVWVEGPIIHLRELVSWAEACKKMSLELSGEANFDSLEPALSIKLSMARLGHIDLEVQITPDHLTQHHLFRFEIDQSYLPDLIQALHRILENFPLRPNQT
jgi:hypothetical protein